MMGMEILEVHHNNSESAQVLLYSNFPMSEGPVTTKLLSEALNVVCGTLVMWLSSDLQPQNPTVELQGKWPHLAALQI